MNPVGRTQHWRRGWVSFCDSHHPHQLMILMILLLLSHIIHPILTSTPGGIYRASEALKCSQVFECPSKYLSAIKVLEKHCETRAIMRVLLPFVANWQMLALILSYPHGSEPSSFFFAQRTHKSIWDCAQGPEQAAARLISPIFRLTSAFCEMVPALVLQRKVSEMQK